MARWFFRRRRSERASDASTDALLTGISDHDNEASIERDEARESIAAWVVIAGVALESYFRGIDFFTSPDWRSFDDLLGGVLIVAGIAAEIYFGGRASRGRKLQVARLNLIAEQERLARVKIEERLAFRNISGAQMAELIQMLKIRAGQKFRPYSVYPTEEVSNMCQILFGILKAGGWKSIFPTSVYRPNSSLIGVRVSTNPDANRQTLEAAGLLVSALFNVGIIVHPNPTDETIPGDDVIEVCVGFKPN